MLIVKQGAMFNRTFHYLMRSTVRSGRTYLYLFLLPLVFTAGIYLIAEGNLVANSRYVVLTSYFLLPVLFNIFCISALVVNWRESIFIKQISNFGITKITFLGTLFLVNTIMVLVALVFNGCWLTLIDYVSQHHLLREWMNSVNRPEQWVGFIIAIFLSIVVHFSLTILIAGCFKNIYVIQTLCFCIFVLSLIFGDFLINYNFTSSVPMIIISYFIPQKYITWMVYIFYSQSYLSPYNFYVIVPYADVMLSFTNVYGPVFGTFGFGILCSVIAYWSFTKGIKK